jgi:hypothetical protein
MRLTGGIWEGLLSGQSDGPPPLRIRHQDQLIGEAETQPADNGWFVRFRLPTDRLSDGVQTFVIEDSDTGDALAHETIVAGDPAEDSLHAEVMLLRAELDMLKRAFRRHCAEG